MKTLLNQNISYMIHEEIIQILCVNDVEYNASLWKRQLSAM